MHTILKIYHKDLKTIFSSIPTFLIVLGLMILPSLYAWFNIVSSWDPYGHTRNISVAIVNEDTGSTFNKKKIHIGDDIVKNLKNNKQMGWIFTNKKDAQEGVRYGKYYASILIPKDFSKNITSVTGNNLEKPKLIYTVNEKSNAIAPKITDKGLTSLEEEINKNFVQTVNDTMFEYFTKVGLEIEKYRPHIQKMMDLLLYVDDKRDVMVKKVDEFYDQSVIFSNLLFDVLDNFSLIEDSVEKASSISKDVKDLFMMTQDTIDDMPSFIHKDLDLAMDLADASSDASEDAIKIIDKSALLSKGLFSKAKASLVLVKDKINRIYSFLNTFDPQQNKFFLQDFLKRLSSVENKVSNQINTLNTILNTIDDKQTISTDLLNQLQDRSVEIKDFLHNLDDTFENRVEPKLDDMIDTLLDLSQNNEKLIDDIQDQLPIIKNLMKNSYEFLVNVIEDMEKIKKQLPKVSDDLHGFVMKLKKLDQDERIQKMLDLIRGDTKEKSAFIASPISIERNRLFPIPNYGSAMSPFFTTLALWVGALLLLSLLSTHVHSEKTIHQFFGRYLIFMTIGIFQALIVSLGDLLLLKTYVAHPIYFIGFSVYTSIIFMNVVYTLVSVFDNVGKGLGVILLVLQISSSGGTFPVEVVPSFFQYIHPYLPFTYAIAGMRETVGGIIPSILLEKSLILMVYFIGSILFGVLFKEKANHVNEKFLAKMKGQDLFH